MIELPLILTALAILCVMFVFLLFSAHMNHPAPSTQSTEWISIWFWIAVVFVILALLAWGGFTYRWFYPINTGP